MILYKYSFGDIIVQACSWTRVTYSNLVSDVIFNGTKHSR